MNKHIIKKIYLFSSLLVFLGVFIFPFFVNAENSTSAMSLVFNPPCAEKIGILPLGPCTPITDIQTYIVRLYQFAVGISGIVAVGMIVYGAIIIIVKSEDISAKSEGRQIIQDALWGVLLLFASYLLLQSINPDLVKLKDPGAPQIATSTLTQGTLNKISSTTCGMSTKIRAVDGIPIYSGDSTANPIIKANKDQEPYNMCGLRRVLFMHEYKIHDNLDSDYETQDNLLKNRDPNKTEAKFFYNESEVLDKDTIVWTYPYYIKDTNPKDTARCVIYAIREPPPDIETKATTRLVDLNEGITPCLLDDVPTSTIKEVFDVDVAEPVKQLPGWVWGNDPKTISTNEETTKTTPENLEKAKIAMANLSSKSSVDFDAGNGTCNPKDGTAPNGIKNDVLAKKDPLICDPSCNCSQKGITVSPSLLNKLSLLADLASFRITSLTGGPHAQNSSHYSGLAADIVPKTMSYPDFRNKAKIEFGSGRVLCEAYYSDSNFSKISSDLKSSATCKKGDRWHCMSWEHCGSIFFQEGHSGNHLHVQITQW